MITLSSDFGWPYPAAMKGVILQRTDARLVDVTHEFPRQDVRASAFWLREVLPFFPPAVHLVVVDPGVGTDRAAVVVRAGGHALVGPDNGVLLPVARELAGRAKSGDDSPGDPAEEDPFEVFRVAERSAEEGAHAPGTDWPPAPASSTFHGRDVFAPAAGRVHRIGIDALQEDPGFERVGNVEDLRFPTATLRGDGATGAVLVVDGFGNAITNIPSRMVRDRRGADITVNGQRVPVCDTYARRDPGERLVTVGSHGNVELAVNRGRGDEAFDVDAGDPVRLAW